MSSSAHVTDDPRAAGIRKPDWEEFCRDHGLVFNSGNGCWYAGQVEVTMLSWHHAVACWVRFGGDLSMDPELRNLLCFHLAQGMNLTTADLEAAPS